MTRVEYYALDIMGDAGLSLNRREISKPEGLARWLDEALTVLVPEGPVSLMGISYGGWLAGQCALRFPGRLRDLVLLAPAGILWRCVVDTAGIMAPPWW